MKIERVLISVKPEISSQCFSEILEFFSSNSISVFAFEELSAKHGSAELRKFRGEKVDAIFVFGGDGAILRTIERVAGISEIPPIVGVNMGKVGFLTFGEGGLERIVNLLRRDEFISDEKPLMCCVFDGCEFFALNDFVLKSSSLCEFEVTTDKYTITKVRADGVIVASQTGSTAYSLSVGGPVVFPDLEIFVISFIAPFSLSIRPYVISPERTVKVNASKDCEIYADGRMIGSRRHVEVFFSKKTIKILRDMNFDFAHVLKKKLE